MYKSPIELIYDDIQYQVEEGIYKAVQKVDIKVDRQELIKALKYDRGQYDKGYEDAKAEHKKGKWIRSGEGPYEVYECSSCGKPWLEWWASVGDSDWMSKKLKYCPNCGAEMGGEEDDAEEIR